MYHIHSIEPEDDESDEAQADELEKLSEAEFEKLSPEEKLLRAIFGQAPVSKSEHKGTTPPPPSDARAKRTTQAEPEHITMRFGFEQPLVPADLARRVAPTVEAVAHLDVALRIALGDALGADIEIQRIAYGSPLEVELAQVSPSTSAVLHALAQNQDLLSEEQARLKDLEFQLLKAQVEGARLANQEQSLKNIRLQAEIDSLRLQQLVTMFDRLFPQISEPMRLAIIAQNFPELRLLMPPNIQVLFDAGPLGT